jgi:hypothetical protein
MMTPRMSLSVFFLARLKMVRAMQLDISPTLSAIADEVIE